MFTRTIAAAAAFGIGLGASFAAADEMRFGDWQSPTHIVSVEGTTHWMKAVEKATGGKISFQHFPAEQAAKASALLDAVNNGVLDAALVGPSYHGESLPLNSVIDLPGFYGSALEGTEALQKMLAEGSLRDEFLAAGVTPIFGFVLPPYQILAKSRLGKPADFKGLDIRTSGATQAMTARALGGAGISLPGPEVYTAMETGRLDAILFPLASVPGYNLQEVVSHISRNASFGGYSFVVIVRSELFDELPEDQRRAMVEAGAETAINVAKAQDTSIAGLIEQWKAKGIDVYDFTDDELATLKSQLSSVSEDWLKRVGRNSDEAKAVLARYGELTGAPSTN